MLLFLCIFSVLCEVNGVYYDSYSGKEITREEVRLHDKANNTFWCVTEAEPCDPNEGRRVDGTCNNLQNPSRGAQHTPFARVLPPVYSANFEAKTTASGKAMPLARYLRTSLFSVGSVPSVRFTTLATYDFVFMSADIASLQDTVNYILWKPYCCLPQGRADYMCAPNKVPDDDPVHRFSGVRCVNQTRPETFQTVGCIKNDTAPERIVSSTPLLDLSTVYGNQLQGLQLRGRLYEGGLLKFEVDSEGRIWPPSVKTNVSVCLLNQPPQETRCHATPEDGANTLAGINLMAIWFWRYHNYIAKNLAKINPCWDDDRLFRTARDINIAVSLQIYYYELLPLFLGYENLVIDGVLTADGGFNDPYDESVIPQVSLEYPFILRWVHTIQEGPLKLYDTDGSYLKQVPIVNLTLHTGFFAVDNNLDYATQGSFRQASAKIDYTAHPDVTELIMGPLQRVSDVLTSDLAKNRHFGFPPYIEYKKACFGKITKTFADLEDLIDEERIEMLKDAYESVEDIDLLAGIWLERPVAGGYVPATFYCLVVDQLRRNMVSDRHWYERPNRPEAFTYDQLSEIRRISIAQMFCDVADKVTKIQPQAFLKAGPGNEMTDCSYIPRIDFNAWADYSCYLPKPSVTKNKIPN